MRSAQWDIIIVWVILIGFLSYNIYSSHKEQQMYYKYSGEFDVRR